MAATSTKTQQGVRDVYYSIGTDQRKNLKEKIAEVHGADLEIMRAMDELDHYVSDPETRKSPWYWNFYRRVRSAMWCLYPHANDIVRTTMTRQFMDELLNGGYIRALQALSNESGPEHVSFSQEYAEGYGVSIGAVLLFGPRGGAILELLHFLAAERVHGMHRHGTSPNPLWSEKTRQMWYDAQRTGNWPRIVDENGEEVSLDVIEEQGHLPEGVATTLREMWRCNPALRNYMGINPLSGDIPYQIVEDALDILIRKKFSPLSEADRARYDQIIEDANKQGIEPFYAVYRHLFANKDRLRSYWNRARKLLYDYSISLWQTKNEIWSAEGRRVPASGAVYRAEKTMPRKPRQTKVPGTIYLNNGGYYWVVANKMKCRPLIDPRTKPKVPGGFIVNNGRYYWWIPGWVRRQRLVPKGEKFSTKDKAIALRIAKKLWNRIKKNDPELAANVQKHTRTNGTATKDRATAERIAARMWRDIKENDPELTARILMDNRPKATDHWYAQIVVNGKHRFVGSFKTRSEAEAAYAREFEKIWGYPPGYNVQCIPKIDKVWPTWAEEKARLALMDEHPRMPVIGKSTKTESLKPMVERMQRVDWLVRNAMLVFEGSSPVSSQDIAIQSRGNKWYAEIKKQGKRPVICGSASMDADTGRIRITLYNQGLDNKRVLAEEMYHIGYKIIRHSELQTLEAIQRWYERRLRNGADPTFSMPDMFATTMALEDCGIATSLPRSLVKHAQRMFSPAHRIPASVMEEVKTSWSLP
jgi:hypothetical protein